MVKWCNYIYKFLVKRQWCFSCKLLTAHTDIYFGWWAKIQKGKFIKKFFLLISVLAFILGVKRNLPTLFFHHSKVHCLLHVSSDSSKSSVTLQCEHEHWTEYKRARLSRINKWIRMDIHNHHFNIQVIICVITMYPVAYFMNS